MKSYVINLNRSSDRLSFMSAQFAAYELPFERVEAVDGRLFSNDELATYSQMSQNWPDPLGAAEIGCFLSHRKCLEKAANSDEAFTAIFEDDVTLSKGAALLLSSDKWIPSDADIVKIEASGHEVLISRPVVIEDQYAVTRLRSRHLLTGGYVVSRSGAQRLLKLMNKVPAPIDHFLFDPEDGPFNEFDMYQVTPAICWQSGLESTIGNNRPRKRRPAFFPLLWREAKRFVRRTMRNTKGTWVNLTRTGKWGPIPRDNNVS